MTHHIPLSVLKRSNPFNAICHTLILEQLWEVLLQFHESFPLPTYRVGGPKYLTGDIRDSLTNIFVVTHTPEKVTQAFSCSVYMCLPKPPYRTSVSAVSTTWTNLSSKVFGLIFFSLWITFYPLTTFGLCPWIWLMGHLLLITCPELNRLLLLNGAALVSSLSMFTNDLEKFMLVAVLFANTFSLRNISFTTYPPLLLDSCV